MREHAFSLHAATHAGAQDLKGREALLRYILRPPLAAERRTGGPDGLVRITLKRAFSDGTFAIDLDPLSLLCRLAATVPRPAFTPFATPASWRRRRQ
ncbi:MAG: transposase [Polyangiaceae bacterium]